MKDGRRLRVLLVAPEAPGLPPLAWAGEAGEIAAMDGVELEIAGGPQATLTRVSGRLRGQHELVVWSGHGGANTLALADGVVDGEWLACQLRQSPPEAALLAACFSAAQDAALDSLTETVSRAGINVVGMWVDVADRAALVYTREFVRALLAGAGVATADRVANRMMVAAYPAAAGTVHLVPGLLNGYGEIHRRLDRLESGFEELRRDFAGVQESALRTQESTLQVRQQLELIAGVLRGYVPG